MKTNFTIDVATRKMNEDKQEIWLLEDSTAYNEEQNALKDIQTKQSELKTEISSLENKKQSLNEQIQQLNGEVTKIKGEPKTYPAGQLTVGTDVFFGISLIIEMSRSPYKIIASVRGIGVALITRI